jgi:hypothetical protein
LSSRTRSTGNQKKTKFKETDRVFSLSSVTSQQAIKDIGVTKSSLSSITPSQHEDEDGEILDEEDDEFYEEDLLNPNGKRKRNSNGQFKKKK